MRINSFTITSAVLRIATLTRAFAASTKPVIPISKQFFEWAESNPGMTIRNVEVFQGSKGFGLKTSKSIKKGDVLLKIEKSMYAKYLPKNTWSDYPKGFTLNTV
jgi:hypothetical protein